MRYAKAVLSLVLERLSGAAGRGSGSFLGGLFNNPGVVILGGLAIALVFFSGDIRKAFASFGENIGKVELPDITLPTINFPDIKLPSFGDLFGGGEPDPSFIGPPEPEGPSLLDQFFNLFPSLPMADAPEIPTREADIIGGEAPFAANPIQTLLDQVQKTEFVEMPALADTSIPIAPSLLDQIIGQFQGGGVSFEGGQIFETPIENLSLNQIINQGLASSASEAASLRREAEGFEGISGFIPESFFTQADQGLPEGIEAPDFGGFTGDPQFEGLTTEEIAIRLTGGNISNF